MASPPVPLWELLNEDPDEVLADLAQQLVHLAARVVLAHLRVQRIGNREISEARLDQVAASLRHAVEDVRAARRSWQAGR